MTGVDPRAMAFLSGQPGPGPETLHIDLTNACNFDCIYCWHYSPLRSPPVEPAWRGRRLPVRLAMGAIRDAAGLGTPRVLFSGGGEPLLHPDFFAILQLCADLGLKTTLISNLSTADLLQLRRHPPDKVLANCSAATEATYLETHPNRRPGAWERFRQTVRALSTLSEVTLVFVVTRHNAVEVERVLDLASQLGAARVQYKLADLHGSLTEAAISEGGHQALHKSLPTLRAKAVALGVQTTLEAFERELAGPARAWSSCNESAATSAGSTRESAPTGACTRAAKTCPSATSAARPSRTSGRGASMRSFGR